MSEYFNWKCICFTDESNPFICKTEAEFNRIKEKYKLKYISRNFWEAKVKPEPDLFKVEVTEDGK